MNTLLTLLALGLGNSPAPAPLHCPEPLAAKGDIKGGPPLGHTFELIHRGPAGKLTIIQVEAGCGCLKRTLSADVLQTGETARLTFEINTLTQPDGPNRWQAIVQYTFEPAGPGRVQKGELAVAVTAKLSREITIAPPQLALSTTGQAAQTITLTDRRPNKSLKVTRVASPPFLSVEVRPQNGATAIEMKLAADAPPGDRDEVVTLLTDDPVYPEFRIPVRISKRSPDAVAAAPDRIAVRFGAGQEEVSALVQLRAPEGKNVRIESAQSGNSSVGVKYSTAAGRVAVVRVTVGGAAAAQSGSSQVTIRLAEPAAQEIVLPVSWVGAIRAEIATDDWPQWLGPKRDGVWRETGILDKFPAGGPKVLWRQPCGAGYSSPSIAAGKLYLTDFVPDQGQKLPDGGFAKSRTAGKERLTCRDAATGKEAWTVDYPAAYAIAYPGGPRVMPTVDGDRVYTLGAVGDLRCHEAATGKLAWSKNFPKDYDSPMPVWGFAAHPLVDGDRLICLAGGSNGRLVIAFDKKTGREVWTSQSCPGDFGYCSPMIYEFGGKRQLIIWHPKAVVGLEPDSGKRIWRIDFEARASLTAPTPRKVGDDGLFITSFYNGSMLMKVGADRADIVWKSAGKGERPDQTTDLNSIIPTPVVDGNFVYGVCSYGQLRCLQASTGKRIWETMRATRGKLTPPKVAAEPEPSPSERWSNAFITPQDGRYFLFNEQGDLIIAKLSPKAYEEIDRAHLLDPTNTMAGRKVVWVAPAFANKCIFVRNDIEVIGVSLAK
jgi:outer membrane protein assembly factor BamB